jgi:hypothetical protein
MFETITPTTLSEENNKEIYNETTTTEKIIKGKIHFNR